MWLLKRQTDRDRQRERGEGNRLALGGICVCVLSRVCACESCVSCTMCLFLFVSVFLCGDSFRECEVCLCDVWTTLPATHDDSHICFCLFSFFFIIIVQTENSHLLTIQPDLTTTTTSYQGTLRSRHDATGKFSMTNGPLLDPLPNGSHTLHNGKLNSDPAEFVSRLSTQSYFKTLPRDVANTSYGTFNFLGGRLTIPNTGGFFVYAHIGVIKRVFFLRFSVASN